MADWTTPDVQDLSDQGRWDAEAFSPLLRQLDSKFRNSPKLIDLASVTHPAEIPRNYSSDKDAKLFLLAQNIRPLLLDTSTKFRITRAKANSIPANRLRTSDVLVTRSGANSGTCAVYLNGDGDCYTSGEGLIIRSHGGIDGAYLAAFLSTKIGQVLCKRAIYGSGQPHIGPKYLEQIAVPRLGALEDHVSKLVRAAHGELKAAEKHYPNAEAELLERLRWNEALGVQEISFATNFAELNEARRFDPEFFRPSPNRIRNWLSTNGALSVGEVCHFVEHGIQPPYIRGGTVGIVSQRQFRTKGLSLELLENFTDSSFVAENPKFRIRKWDVLTYCVSAGEYLGRTYLFNSDIECVAASFVTILRTTQLVPGYLALFLNSPAGLIQSNMFKRGTSPFYLYPRDLKQVLIAIPRQRDGNVDTEWQRRLAAKVELASAASVGARKQLEEAKLLIEEAIKEQQSDDLHTR